MSANAETVRVPGIVERPHSSGGWSSRLAFILAAAGSAVGLGNVWKFPYIVGEYGGGAFVLVYLACIAVIGVPILMAEILLGRRGGGSPVHSFEFLAESEGQSPNWKLIGWMGIVSAALILSFYSVVAGWSLAYLWFAIDGYFSTAGVASDTTPRVMEELFSSLLANPTALIVGHSIIMATTIIVVARGVRAGLERAVRWMVPSLFVLLLALVVYSATTTGQFSAAVGFLFRPDFSALSWEAVLVALGHAFFTLSVGMTAMMAYGSYLKRDVSIANASVTIAGLDTLVALLAGLAIFPIVFANGLQPGSGPGLIFVTLPIAFVQLPGGNAVAMLFFLFLAIAAVSSTISILEPVVEYLEQRRKWKRRRAALTTGACIWLFGLGSALSFNVGSEFTVFGKTLFDLLDFLTANVLLPLGGLLIAVYAGHVLSRRSLAEELGIGDSAGFRLWRFLLRYVTPVGVSVVLFNSLL